MTRNRIESLARELAEGASVERAMLAVGYAPETARQGRVQHNGRLVSPNNHPDVAARMADIRAAAREWTTVTIGDIVAKLEEAFEFARANCNPSAMVAAKMGQARVLGLIVQRHRRTVRPIDQLTEAECMALLGEDDGAGRSVSASSRDHFPRVPAALFSTRSSG